MGLVRISAPAEYVISVDELVEHLKLDSDDDRDYIEALLQSAIDHVDGKYGVLGKALIPQTWEYTLDMFPAGAIALPLPPLIKVDSVDYDIESGDDATVDVANYFVDTASVPGRIVPVDGFSWPSVPCAPGAVRIVFTAGHEQIGESVGESSGSIPSSAVPASIKHAIKLIVADWYKNREDRVLLSGPHVNIPTAAKALLDQHAIPAFA